MANMIESLGRDWFQRRCAGGHFLFNGEVLAIAAADEDVVLAKTLEGAVKKVPVDFFTGFKVFAYPQLGYRKFGKHLAVFFKKKHSYNRGLRNGCVVPNYSPVSEYLVHKHGRAIGPDYAMPRSNLSLVFKPVYDKPAAITELLKGERPTVVLNADILVEPNMQRADAEDYIVYHRERPCATITEQGVVHWYTDAYKQAIEPILRPRGAW